MFWESKFPKFKNHFGKEISIPEVIFEFGEFPFSLFPILSRESHSQNISASVAYPEIFYGGPYPEIFNNLSIPPYVFFEKFPNLWGKI
jgi:hypothetical protein